jgi:hypothetical protein
MIDGMVERAASVEKLMSNGTVAMFPDELSSQVNSNCESSPAKPERHCVDSDP